MISSFSTQQLKSSLDAIKQLRCALFLIHSLNTANIPSIYFDILL
jgi:hypothetical protein